jgi:hypothetical protein
MKNPNAEGMVLLSVYGVILPGWANFYILIIIYSSNMQNYTSDSSLLNIKRQIYCEKWGGVMDH